MSTEIRVTPTSTYARVYTCTSIRRCDIQLIIRQSRSCIECTSDETSLQVSSKCEINNNS